MTVAVSAQPPDPAVRPAPRGSEPPVPSVRAVARIAPIPAPTARGRATVAGAIDPVLRSAPPFVPPSRRAVGRARPAEIDEARATGPAPVELVRPVAEPPESVAGAETDKSDIDRSQIPPAEDPSGPSAAPNLHVPATQTDVPVKVSRLRRGAGRALLPICVALIAAFVAGTGYLIVTDRPGTGDVGRFAGVPAAQPGKSQDAAPFAVDADSAADPFGTRGPGLTGPPTRLKVEAIGVDTPLETLRLDSAGELTPPTDFAKAGWYADGTGPGDTGPAVLAGHVDSKRGPAVFYNLRKLVAGDRIEVVRGGETITFTVTSAAWYPKSKFPTEAVYGATPDRQLRLITCGGVFDHSLRSYKDNLVVYAVAG